MSSPFSRDVTVQDHKATDAVEKARIEAAGGFVTRKRVMGVLAVARAFGDFVLKKFVTAEPYTSTTKLDTMVGCCRYNARGSFFCPKGMSSPREVKIVFL